MFQEAALGRSKAGTGTPFDFTGIWTNELQSSAVITQTNETLSGTYESAVSTGGTKTTGDLVGYVDGDLIAFTVHWRDYQAITSWVGQLVPSQSGSSTDTLKTLWQMVKQVAEGSEWSSVNAGSDTFSRTQSQP